jgi:hypothetical protein
MLLNVSTAKRTEHYRRLAMTTNPSAEPVCKSISKEQMLGRAREFMRTEVGVFKQMELEQKHAWLERLGLLVLYIDHLWEQS